MTSIARALGIVAALLQVGSTLHAQVAPTAQVNLTGQEVALLRDVIAKQWANYKGQDGQLCLDPTVAVYRAKASTPRERWSNDVVSRIAATVRLSLDTLTTELFGGLPGCARSRDLSRLAYGRARIYQDSAAMVFVNTRLDSRGQVDTMKADLRLARRNGEWRVDGVLADTMSVHSYVKGDGCYRLWYAPLDASARVDTIEVAAERTSVAANWLSLPAYRVSMRVRPKDFSASRWPTSTWHVTHDSVHFEWGGNGWEVAFADLHVVGDSLRGALRFETDAIVPNPPTTPIEGRRIPCEARR